MFSLSLHHMQYRLHSWTCLGVQDVTWPNICGWREEEVLRKYLCAQDLQFHVRNEPSSYVSGHLPSSGLSNANGKLYWALEQARAQIRNHCILSHFTNCLYLQKIRLVHSPSYQPIFFSNLVWKSQGRIWFIPLTSLCSWFYCFHKSAVGTSLEWLIYCRSYQSPFSCNYKIIQVRQWCLLALHDEGLFLKWFDSPQHIYPWS